MNQTAILLAQIYFGLTIIATVYLLFKTYDNYDE
tara:strand:+ start:14125 stop:14226 length:102 start_codon:yes stop_codon:yes gene_type:complete